MYLILLNIVLKQIDNYLDFKKLILRVNIFRGEKLDLEVGKIQVMFIFLFVFSEYIVVLDRINQIWVSRFQKRLDFYRIDMNRYQCICYV